MFLICMYIYVRYIYICVYIVKATCFIIFHCEYREYREYRSLLVTDDACTIGTSLEYALNVVDIICRTTERGLILKALFAVALTIVKYQ